MGIEMFVAGLGGFLAILFVWGFNTLTGEKWQIIGAVPVRKDQQGGWTGINFTFYGFFNACAYSLATIVYLLLLAAANVPYKLAILFLVIILAICMPAARFVAYLVEQKRYNFSVGGAIFVGMLVAPWLVIVLRNIFDSWMAEGAQVVIIMAALATAYAFGEGVGRLACISFGCCYGKPLKDVHPVFQKIFKRFNFVFKGNTRKIVYADGFDGVQVVPVQALTAILYCSAGLISLYVFMKSHFTAAFIISMLTTQIWRFFSEFIRADYRGESRISKYQLMALISAVYSIFIAFFFPAGSVVIPSIGLGLRVLWQPALIVLIQILWLVVFVYTGRSQVTGARMSFHVIQDRI